MLAPFARVTSLMKKNDRCRKFVKDPAPTAQLSIGAYTLTKLKRCFSVFKAMVLDAGQAIDNGSGGGGDSELARYRGYASVGEGGNGGVAGKPGGDDAGQLGGQVRCSPWRKRHNLY